LRELIIDSFAGGGGASTGIEQALGRYVDIAINHDEAAILMHKTNHPHTKHYCENIWEVDPKEATKGQKVGLMWASPDCKHFSKAKGGKPVDKNIRGLAWVVVKWAKAVRPRVIILENVEEFKTWGPLIDNRPDPERKGETFGQFVKALKRFGYKVDWRELRACDYGAPTIRKRFFLIARNDGKPIRWPKPTHGDPDSLEVHAGLLKPWRTAAECIDWTIPCPSIFTRNKPLAEKTTARIARGIQKFVIDNPNPYILDNQAHFITQYHSYGNEVRGQEMDRPLMTQDTSNRYGLVTSHLIKFKGDNIGQRANEPIQTITAGGMHFGEVRVFLVSYYGSENDIGQRLDEPLRTITAKDRFGIVTVQGQDYRIVDIGMRMLQPHELFKAQGFPGDYIIDRDYTGKAYPKTHQVARCGNSVCPPIAEALVRVNLPEMIVKKGEETG
jgi:DNA (cytosine-5)-methyltransferase 1